jgi:AsmA family protein
MRVVKWVVGGIVVLLVALVVAVFAIVKTLDLNQYRELIAQRIETTTGRKVTIAGPIDLEASLSPALALSDVSLANAGWSKDPQMLTVKRFEAKVALLPLLSKQVRVERIVLSGADIRLETDANGVGNWILKDGAAAEPAPPPPPSSETAGGEVLIPAFDEVAVEDSMLTYRDGRTGQVTTLAIEKLQAAAPSRTAPMKIEVVARYNDNPIEAKGTLGAMASLIAGDPVAVDLEAKAGGANLRVLGDLGKPGVEKGTNLVVSAEGSQLGELSQLAGTPIPALGPYKASLRLQETKGVFSANAIEAVIGSESLLLASATGSIANLAAADGINLQVELKGPSLAALNEPAKLNLPPIGPYEIGAAVSGNRNALQLKDLAATVGGSDLSGMAALTLAGPRPAIEATLTSNKLALADFTGSGSGGGAGNAAPSQPSDGRVFPADPLPLEGLKAVDAVVRFTGRSLVLEKVVLDNVAATATLRNGRLLLDPVKSGVSGGTVAIKADLDGGAAKPAVALTVTSRQVEVGSLLKLLQVSDVLSGGKADLDLSVTGSGESVRAIMAGLDGSTRLVMGPGKINNKFAKILLADLGGLIAGGGDSSAINCMVSDFGIAKGQATAKALVLDTNGATILGSGRIDLASERLDLRFDPSAKQPNLANLAVPVKVGGTLASPSVVPDPGKIAENVVGTVVGAPQGIFDTLSSLTGQKAAAAGVNPCAAALSGKAQPAKSTTATGGTTAGSGATGGTAAPASSGKGVVEDAVQGLGNTLNNLLGGGSSGGATEPSQGSD